MCVPDHWQGELRKGGGKPSPHDLDFIGLRSRRSKVDQHDEPELFPSTVQVLRKKWVETLSRKAQEVY